MFIHSGRWTANKPIHFWRNTVNRSCSVASSNSWAIIYPSRATTRNKKIKKQDSFFHLFFLFTSVCHPQDSRRSKVFMCTGFNFTAESFSILIRKKRTFHISRLCSLWLLYRLKTHMKCKSKERWYVPLKKSKQSLWPAWFRIFISFYFLLFHHFIFHLLGNACFLINSVSPCFWPTTSLKLQSLISISPACIISPPGEGMAACGGFSDCIWLSYELICVYAWVRL